MIPKKYDAHEYDYPDFQPDQVLSADHLNHSFAFNEQQERLTRTNLIGIGIVCGLKATKSSDGKTITITKGTGVTSQGYLIVHGKENSEEAIEYKKYRSFNAVQDIKYDVFVSGITARYTIWELLDDNEAKPEDAELSNFFLGTKVCLLFYEMLEVDAKNCDTTSCDDKGKTVTITVRKLLVNSGDADTIIAELNAKSQASGSGEVFPGITALPELRLPRFDVTATVLGSASDVYKAYQKVFTQTFVESTGKALNSAYGLFKKYLKDSSDPFANFNTAFAFLHNNTISGNDLLHFQYYWDFFCDLIAAYNEWRLAAQPLGAICTPPEALFPRHLFLCNFGEADGIEKSKYRNYFIPSPLLAQQEKAYKEFQSLFQRLTRMVSNKSLPIPMVAGSKTADINIRVTPSLVGNFPLGYRAIPYYYKANEAANKLVDVWNYEETKLGKQKFILSYAHAYNNNDDFVINPLRYDLEAYNFFRVEGHIGKSFDGVLSNLKTIVNTYRLPIDVIALELGNDVSGTTITDVCSIANIQIQYEMLKADAICCLKKGIAFWGKLEIKEPPKTAGGNIVGGITGDLVMANFAEKNTAMNINADTYKLTEALKQVEDNFKTASPKVMEEVRKMVTSIGSAGAKVPTDPPKALLIKNTMEYFSEDSIAGKYLGLQQHGNISIGSSSSAPAVFNAAALSHYALVIVDEMQELLLLLQATDVIAFDLVNFGLHTEALKKVYTTLGDLLSVYLNSQKSVYTLKAMLGDTFNSKVDAIAASMPEILEKNVNTIILLLLNPLDSTTINTLIADLQKAISNTARQQVIDAAFARVDKDGMMIPAAKVINYKEDPVLADINSKLKNPACTCSYESFQKLYDLLKKEMDAMKQMNLFSVFTKKHPGIQHKSGVTMGGTFIIAYHKKGTPSIPLYEEAIKNMADGVVVADFYLPYLCSSDCQPINFTVTIPPQTITLGLEKLEFCNDDPAIYAFQTNPTGGKMTSSQQDSIKDNGDGTFSFLPSKVKIDTGASATATYTYTLADQMQTISVKVYAKPEVIIIATPDATNPLKVNFVFDKPFLASGTSWSFGDATTSAELAPSHTYGTAGTYTVSCVVKNGVCSFKPENAVVDVKAPEPVVIGLSQTQVCKDAAPISFTVTPAGGIFTGEGISEAPPLSGNFTFTPSAVASNGTPQKTVTFNYNPVTGSPKTANITVFEKPEGIASIKVILTAARRAQVVLSNLKNAGTLEVDFNDGTAKSSFNVGVQNEFTSPPHLFPGSGPFKVLARLVNGTCALVFEPLEVSFPIVEEPAKACQPLDNPLKDYSVFEKSDAFVVEYTEERMKEVDEFFEKLKEQLNQSPNVPLSFFVQNPLKANWISALPVNNEQTRDLAIQLLGIFSDLVTTISCLKGEDINEGNVPTTELLQIIVRKIEELQRLSDRDRILIETLVRDARDERKRIATNLETGKKKEFIAALIKIEEAIKNLA